VPKLTDLGLVKVREGGADLTRANSGLGTPNFMAPEQFGDAKNADARCDVYSLGATMYMTVTGELPFRARGLLQTMEKKLRSEVTPPRQIVPGLSLHIEQAIRRALNPDPRLRQASCLEFATELTAVPDTPDNDQPSASSRSSKDERRVSVRFSSKQDSSCAPLGGERACRWPAKIQDISSTGLSLLLGRRFEPGTLLLLQPEGGEDPSLPQTLLVRVRNARSQPRRKWLLGCTFARRLSEEEVRLMV
jgi:serine/threonine protein kinase